MKDLDLKKYVILSKQSKDRLLDQMEKDTRFLAHLNIMDYSLLLGVYYMKIAHEAPQGVYPRGRGLSYDVKDRLDEQRRSSEKALLTSYAGGVRAQVIEGPGIYYMGIIDILQNYTLQKKAEHFLKRYVLRKDGMGISCVDPITYQKRFMGYMRKIIVDGDQFYMEQAVNMDQFVSQTLFVYPGEETVKTNMRQMRMSFVGSGRHGIPGLANLQVPNVVHDSKAEDDDNDDDDDDTTVGDTNGNEQDDADKQQSSSNTPVVNDTIVEMENIKKNSQKKTPNNYNDKDENKDNNSKNDSTNQSEDKNSSNNIETDNDSKTKTATVTSNSMTDNKPEPKEANLSAINNNSQKKNANLQTGYRSNSSDKSKKKALTNNNIKTNTNIKFTKNPNTKDLSVKLSPRSPVLSVGGDVQTPVESHSRTGPPTRATSHSVTGTGVTISGTEASDADDDHKSLSPQPSQPLSTQVNHNNRILVTRHNDEPTPDVLDGNQHQKNALSVSPALVDDLSANQLHDPIEPSVTATSMGVFSHSYADAAARRSDIGLVTSYTDRTAKSGGTALLGGMGSTDVEKSEAAGGLNQTGHKTMLSGSIIPPQDPRVSEFYPPQGRDGRGMSVITDDGRVSVTDFGTELPLAGDENDTLRSRSDVNQFDETKENAVKPDSSVVNARNAANSSVTPEATGTNMNRNLSANSMTQPSKVTNIITEADYNRAREKTNTVTVNTINTVDTEPDIGNMNNINTSDKMPSTLKFAHSVSASITAESQTDLTTKTQNTAITPATATATAANTNMNINSGNGLVSPPPKHVD